MYLQITTRCNMKCKHCCMSATKKGEDMSLETVKAALRESDGYVTIGGGEPTLHPDFYQILCLCIGATEPQSTHIITNGKIKDVALVLAKMAKAGVIGAELSLDKYHEEIDADVVRAFKPANRFGQPYRSNDTGELQGIRSVSRILARGRGTKVPGAVDECACDDTLIDPKGDVYLCGCKNVKIGDVFNGWKRPDEYPDGTYCDSGTCGHEYLAKMEECESEKRIENMTETSDGCRL
jgi:hypothetical protein